MLGVLGGAATRAARRAPEDTSCEALFDDCTEAHNELHRRRGYSHFQLLIGRSPRGLPLNGDKQLGEVSASLTSDGRHRLHIQRECHRAYLDEEMSLQQRRREMHKSRPFRVWSSGEWCWFWRSRAHLHRRTKASRQFKEGAFLGPARVLLQERERKRHDLKYKAVVVASSDNELHEDFVSGDEFASAPDDSEVPKDPQMSYRTRSASSHAETPAAMSPESTEAPFVPKVEQSSSTARPSVIQSPTVPQSSTSQPSTIPPTASPSHMDYLQSQCLSLEQ